MRTWIHALVLAATLGMVSLCGPAVAQGARVAPSAVLFENVRVFDGKSDRLSAPTNVLVVGNLIQRIGSGALAAPEGATLTRVAGNGRTLMPGMIDAHTHIMFANATQLDILLGDIGYVQIAAAKGAEEMLQRGYTSIRDMGGPVFGLKKAVDRGMVAGPRIWPSGAFISQSGGHGDFRLPTDLPARPGDFTYSERVGAAAIADSPDDVRKRVREVLALGASQVKLMAGGGISSNYDPLDVTQYSVAELRAAVEAAENWGTYVAVHAYTPRAVRQAIEAGVRVIEHGQLLDDATAKLMAEKGVWWSLQPFIDDGNDNRFAEGSPNRNKQLQMYAGTDAAYKLARKYKIKTAWGVDSLMNPAGNRLQTQFVTRMLRWYTPAETLRMITADNAELLALSGERNPYPGKLGVVQEGALADLLLVDGDPLANLKLLEDAARNLLVIMKDGRIYKNIVK
ncbi:hydrolase [beta proteobacterium AAP99]|nr:hydrolase [beta proteobacterium AAP99]